MTLDKSTITHLAATRQGILNTTNPNHITWQYEELHFAILGGIRLEGLDRLRVTIKISFRREALRHNLDLYNDSQQDKFLRKCAERFEMSSLYLRDALSELINHVEEYRMQEISLQTENQTKKKTLTEQEAEAAGQLLQNENLLEVTNELIGKSGIIAEDNNRLLMYLIFTSRKMENPLHVISLGASGIGKSHLQESVAKLIPQEDLIEITTLSENAFYYFERRALSNKLILIEDLDGAESSLYPIRELQSKKRISKTVARKDANGQTKTIHLTVEGPVSVAGCTTKEQVYEDNSNRSFLIYLDESKEQDERIMEYQRSLSAGKINSYQQQKSAELLQNCQRLLEPVKVINPYAELLALPQAVFKPRRTNAHYLQFISAITFFHQFQREKKADQNTGEIFIETTLDDIKIANKLLKETLLRKSDELSGACRNYFERLKKWLNEEKTETFKNADVRKALRENHSNQKRYMTQLQRAGLLKRTKGNKKQGFLYEVLSHEEYQNLKKGIDGVLDGIFQRLKNGDDKKVDCPEALEVDQSSEEVHRAVEPLQTNGILKSKEKFITNKNGRAQKKNGAVKPSPVDEKKQKPYIGDAATNTLQKLQQADKEKPGGWYGAKDLSLLSGKSARTESNYLNDLAEAGLLEKTYSHPAFVFRIFQNEMNQTGQ